MSQPGTYFLCYQFTSWLPVDASTCAGGFQLESKNLAALCVVDCLFMLSGCRLDEKRMSRSDEPHAGHLLLASLCGNQNAQSFALASAFLEQL